MLRFDFSDFQSTHIPNGPPPFYRASRQGGYRFSVKKNSNWWDFRGARSGSSKAAFLFFDENFAFAGMVGLSDDALKFHSFHERCRTIVANL